MNDLDQDILKNLETLVTYNQKIQFYKQKRKEFMLIDTGKEIVENFHVDYFPKINNYTCEYYNLLSKFINLICGLDSTNLNIIESHELWNEIQKEIKAETITPAQPNPFNTFNLQRMNKLNEYIIFDIYQFISEIISIVWNIKFPHNSKFEVSGIGEYINMNNNSTSNYMDFNKYLDFFKIINDIFNAQKHSVINKEPNLIGKEKLCVVAFRLRENDFSKKPKQYCVALDDIISEFNSFYKYSFELIDKLTKQISIV